MFMVNPPTVRLIAQLPSRHSTEFAVPRSIGVGVPAAWGAQPTRPSAAGGLQPIADHVRF